MGLMLNSFRDNFSIQSLSIPEQGRICNLHKVAVIKLMKLNQLIWKELTVCIIFKFNPHNQHVK